ncbi:MAG: hypothetical protein KC416_16585, partial [Myxococcales bacterium]|nr:hypothetical protein [Myxococcales bacterium]
MTTEATVRQSVAAARNFIVDLECAIFTSFTFNTDFFENNALPTALGIEGATSAALAAQIHQALSTTPVSVFFDANFAGPAAQNYKYLPCPIALEGGIFHPKNVILAGYSEEGDQWIYVSVASANLSMSGWGTNAEGFS